MNFTEAEIEDYALCKKPFSPELLKVLDYNIHHFNEYLLPCSDLLSEDNRILSKYFSAALKKQLDVVIPKIVAKYGEFPVRNDEYDFTIHMKAMGQLMMSHGIKLSKLNKLPTALFTHSICNVLLNNTYPHIHGFFNTRTWEQITVLVSRYLNDAGHITKEDRALLSSGRTGKNEESQFIELLTKWLNTMPLEKLRLPEIFRDGNMHFYLNSGLQCSLSERIIESARSESSLFILEREEVKNLLTTYNLTDLIWELVDDDAKKILPIYNTCRSLALSDTQTKEYMRQSLVDIPMDMTSDLSDLTL